LNREQTINRIVQASTGLYHLQPGDKKNKRYWAQRHDTAGYAHKTADVPMQFGAEMVFIESLKIVLRRILLTIHWMLPALAAVVIGRLTGIHPLVITAVVVALFVFRPVFTGPILRTVMVVCAFTPLGRYIIWPYEKASELWKLIGDIPSIFLRLPAYLVYILGSFIATMVVAVIVRPLFALIERESLARQAARDSAAQRIMVCLRKQRGRPRYSLYLRPFNTTGLLASNTVEVSPGSQPGNIQIDFEAILTSAFLADRPLIALGVPGALLPTHPEGMTTWPINQTWDIPGTGKILTTESGWRQDLILLASHAETIVIVPLNFPGTIWEIQWLFDNHMLGKCVFIMPASMGGARGYDKAWKASVRTLSALGIEPPDYHPSGQLFVVEDGAIRSLPSFVQSFVPRTTALLIQFRFLQSHRRKASTAHGTAGGM
jgi:hypothetical protein